MTERHVLLVELTDPTEGAAAVVVSAAMQLFSPTDPVDVVLLVTGVDAPGEELGLLVQQLCLEGATGDLPETVLLGAAEALDLPADLHVTSGRSAVDAALAVAVLTGFAQNLVAPPVDPRLPARVAELEHRVLLDDVARRCTARDVPAALAISAGRRRPTVALVFQHRSYWNAVASVVAALQADPRVDLLVVAVDSTADGRGASTAQFLRERGVDPVSVDHLTSRLSDVDLVLYVDPYDEMRPEAVASTTMAARGVRMAVVPYGSGAIGGEMMDQMLWNLPLMRLAWRSYVPTDEHVAMYDQHCASGSAHVRVVGSAKLDRLVQPSPSAQVDEWRALAKGRPVVLWNPHFRIGEGGWSTFDTYFEPVLRWFMDHRDVVLLLRPHFRLFADLGRRGGPEAQVEATVRRLVGQHDNLLLDDTPDYVDALTAADAMMSDLSSLATEYLVTGRPLLYLHRADGPGAGGAGEHFSLMQRADSVGDVRRWLDAVRKGTATVPDAAGRLGPVDGRAGERVAADLVDSLLGILAPPLPAVPAGPAVVSDVRLGPEGLTVHVTGSASLALTSPRWSPPAVPVVDGVAVLPLRASFFGGPLSPLPSDTYRLEADGPVRLDDAVWQRIGATWRDEQCAAHVQVPGVDGIELVVRGPVEADTDRALDVQRIAYPPARRQPLRNAVLFTSFNGTAAACNPRAIDAELQRRGSSLTRYWVVQDLSVAVPDGAVPLVQGSKEHYEHAATSRWVVDNEAMPAWLDKRPGQVLVQTWHGTPLKRLRWDLHEVSPRDPAFMAEADRDAASWDVVLSANPLTSEVLHRAFRVQGQVLEAGYPRNDVLADPARRSAAGALVRARLGIDADAPLVLHAPTWRDLGVRRSSADGSWSYGATWTPQPVLDVDGVREALGDDAVLLYRGHRYVASTAAELRVPGVRDVSRYPDMAELLAAADVLVTDYSSSFFDYALTGRPMVFFAHDLEDYRDRQRGTYFDMEQVLPGPVVRTRAQVTAALAGLAPDPRHAGFVERFGPWDDGAASARVVDAVFG